MGKYLNTVYVDQVEFYLAANNLTVEEYEEAPFYYPLWNKKQIELYGSDVGLKKDFLGSWIDFNSEKYQDWLFVKYGHLLENSLKTH